MRSTVYTPEFTKYNNPTLRSAILLAPVQTQRNLKLPRVLKWYTKEQIEILLSREGTNVNRFNRFDEMFRRLQVLAKRKNEMFKFTEAEDAFIRNNYQYIPDSVIALALNITLRRVQLRRRQLGLLKEYKPDDVPFVIVWDKRENYERDLTKEGLTLLREGLRSV